MKLKIVFLSVCLICAFMLSGCWDLTEVDRLSFVTTIGVDMDSRNHALVSIQLPLPQRMLPSSLSGQGKQGAQFSIASMTGKTLNEALNMLQTQTYNEVTIQQNKSIIIGERVAKFSVKPLLDFLINYPKAPPQALVFIAHNHTAQEVLSFKPV